MRFLILALFLCSHLYTYSQKAIFSKAESELIEKAADSIFYKTITLTGIPPIVRSVSVTISCNDLNATRGSDYEFIPNMGLRTVTLTPSDNIFTLGIRVRADAYQTEGDERFYLVYSYDSLNVNKTVNDTVVIHDRNFRARFSPDTSKMTVRIVTGSNFDFFDTPTFKNFAGDLNVFVPNIIGNGTLSRPIGFTAGIFNYRYYDADSSGSMRRTENYLLDPRNLTIQPGVTRYIRENSYLNTRTTYNNWGLYIDPMIQVSGNAWHDMFASVHFETIWRTQISSSTASAISKDTLTIPANATREFVVQEQKAFRPLYQKSSYFDIYTGIGLPTKIYIRKAFELFLSPSIGLASFKRTEFDTIQPTRGNQLEAAYINAVTKSNLRLYTLCKFQLTTTVSPVDISLGGEIRGVSGEQTFLGMYLGAAISLDKLKR